jgi:hypothetical protein
MGKTAASIEPNACLRGTWIFLAWLSLLIIGLGNYAATVSWWRHQAAAGGCTGFVNSGLDPSWYIVVLAYVLGFALLGLAATRLQPGPRSRGLNNALLALGVFGVALLARQIFLLVYTEPLALPCGIISPPYSDGAHYHRLAINLIGGLGLTDPPGNYSLEKPLYPLFLAGIYHLSGPDPALIRLVGAFLGAVNAVLLFLLGLRFMPRWAACSAALYYAVYPFAIYLSGRVLTETFFVTLELTALYLLYRFQGRSWLWQILIGVVMGLACLTRPVFLPFPLIMLFWYVLGGRHRRRGLVMWLVMLAALGMTLAPMMVRNYRLTGGQSWAISGSGGLPLLLANNPYNKDGTWVYEAESPEMRKLLEIKNQQNITYRQADAIYRQRALDWIFANPADFTALAAKKLLNFFGFDPHPKRKQLAQKYFWIGLLSYGWLIPIYFAGLALSFKRWREFLPLYALFALYTGIALVYTVDMRKRAPLDPVLILLAGLFVSQMASWWKYWRHRTTPHRASPQTTQ